MNANKRIRERRLALGLSDTETAKSVGLSIYEYSDVEQHADEIYSLVHLHNVKKICEVLNLDFFDLFDLRCAFCEGTTQYTPDYQLPRNELVHEKRTQVGISRKESGDRVGFEEAEIGDMEENPDYLESWSIDLIRDLSDALGVPLQVLAAVKCKKCDFCEGCYVTFPPGFALTPFLASSFPVF